MCVYAVFLNCHNGYTLIIYIFRQTKQSVSCLLFNIFYLTLSNKDVCPISMIASRLTHGHSSWFVHLLTFRGGGHVFVVVIVVYDLWLDQYVVSPLDRNVQKRQTIMKTKDNFSNPCSYGKCPSVKCCLKFCKNSLLKVNINFNRTILSDFFSIFEVIS